MNIRFLFVVAFLLVSASAYTFAQGFSYSKDFDRIQKRGRDTSDQLYFPKLLERFERNDTTLANSQVLCLLIGFTNDSLFKPYSDLDIEARIYNLNGLGHNQEALRVADSFLVSHPVSQATLIEKS